MKLVDMPRGTGKSYNLCQLSERTGIPVVMFDQGLIENYKKRFPNAIIISFKEYSVMNNKPKEIYLDECIIHLQRFLFPQSNIKIATYSNEEYQNEKHFILEGIDE